LLLAPCPSLIAQNLSLLTHNFSLLLLKAFYMKRIAIFASGNGTNAQNIIEHFIDNPEVEVSFILSNRKNAFVLKRAEKFNIPSLTFNHKEFYETEIISRLLIYKKIDLIVLAGFLWLIPDHMLKAFPGRIINIHPALLPGVGGKGYYGMKVHEAVMASGAKESGITIHYVNEKYDDGQTIFQARCPVVASDTAESLAQKVHALEYAHFPEVITQMLKKIETIK